MIYEYDWDVDLTDKHKEIIQENYMMIDDVRKFMIKNGYNVKRGQVKNYLIQLGAIYVISSNDVRKGKYIDRFDLDYKIYIRAGILIIHKQKNNVNIIDLRIHQDVVKLMLSNEETMRFILKQPTKINYYGGN